MQVIEALCSRSWRLTITCISTRCGRILGKYSDRNGLTVCMAGHLALADAETVMGEKKRPPRILEISWGRMEVEGLGAGKDFKLYPGGGREWDWAETGTRHSPGVQPADVDELLAHGASTVVLSQGMDRRLQIAPATHDYLDRRCITVHVAETREAVKIYNELAGAVPVAGLFHSTC